MNKINEFLTTEQFNKFKISIPKNRDEYLSHAQISYNLKINTSVPSTVHIEPTNICNQKCYMCVYPDMKRKAIMIDDEVAYRAIDECADIGVYALHFFYFGEPFINKKTIEYIGYAKKKNIPLVSTTTNFCVVEDVDIKKLIDCQIDSIHISFEGINRQNYLRIRGTDHYNVVKRNIYELINQKTKMNSDKPWIALTYVRTNESDDEIENFKRAWSSGVNDIHISPQFDYLGRSKIRRDNPNILNSEQIMDRDDKNRLPCRQLWLRLVVLSNGELVPCSQNIDGELSVGNIKNTTIQSAWTSEEMLDLRMQHLLNRYEDNCVCKNCIDWDWSGKFDKRPNFNMKRSE